jgi:hypothetical protein
VAQRRKSNAALRAAIERSGKPATERWPRTIEERFKTLGQPLAYRTIYSRMSSEAAWRRRRDSQVPYREARK